MKFADTPLVRASGRELSYVILAGLLLCFLNTFILLAKPGVIICMCQRLDLVAKHSKFKSINTIKLLHTDFQSGWASASFMELYWLKQTGFQEFFIQQHILLDVPLTYHPGKELNLKSFSMKTYVLVNLYRSQILITSVLASVQFFGTMIWIFVTFPDAEKVYPFRHEVKNLWKV